MDNEEKGVGNSINYKYRVHDSRLGRFLSIDPLAPKYPHNSPYAFSENRVIDCIELEGLEAVKSWGVLQQGNECIGTGVTEDVCISGKNPHNTPLEQALALKSGGYGPNNSEQALALEHYENGTGLNIESPLSVGLEAKLEITIGARVAGEIDQLIGGDLNLGSVSLLRLENTKENLFQVRGLDKASFGAEVATPIIPVFQDFSPVLREFLTKATQFFWASPRSSGVLD
jgi:hypothetical protein